MSDFIEECNVRARVEVAQILLTMESLMMLRGFAFCKAVRLEKSKHIADQQ